MPTAGDELNLTCTATVPERLVYTPDTVVISYDSGGQMVVSEENSDATQTEVFRDGNVFSRTVTINPLKNSDARRYYCIVSCREPLDTITNHNDNLQVNSELISFVISSLIIVIQTKFILFSLMLFKQTFSCIFLQA